jgi:hypothetical protein
VLLTPSWFIAFIISNSTVWNQANWHRTSWDFWVDAFIAKLLKFRGFAIYAFLWVLESLNIDFVLFFKPGNILCRLFIFYDFINLILFLLEFIFELNNAPFAKFLRITVAGLRPFWAENHWVNHIAIFSKNFESVIKFLFVIQWPPKGFLPLARS